MISRKEAISIGASAAAGMLFPTSAFAVHSRCQQQLQEVMAPCYPANGTRCFYLDPKYLDIDIQGMSIQEVIDLFECSPSEINFYCEDCTYYSFTVSTTGDCYGIIGVYGVICKNFTVYGCDICKPMFMPIKDYDPCASVVR